jgi:uncharacterized protein
MDRRDAHEPCTICFQYTRDMPNLNLSLLQGRFAVVQLAANADVPAWALEGDFFTVSRTSEELSVVCLEANVPDGLRLERDWVCLKLQGPFEFSMTGILGSVLEPLVVSEVGIFAISTFNTDYVLVKAASLERAIVALEAAGHRVTQVTQKS